MVLPQLNPSVKIGLVVVSASCISELRYPQAAPAGVGFLTSRMLLGADQGLDGLRAMEANSVRAVEELASAGVDAIAYCCTVSGALRGPEQDRQFCAEMERQWNTPTTSTMRAAVEALQRLNARRIVVATPYPDSHHTAEQDYLEASGIQPLAMRGMGLHTAAEFAAVPPDEIRRFCLEAWEPWAGQAEALFISCMNFDGMAAAQALEDAIGKPVVTSHSATLWRALSLAGVTGPVSGYGRLLAQPRAVRQLHPQPAAAETMALT